MEAFSSPPSELQESRAAITLPSEAFHDEDVERRRQMQISANMHLVATAASRSPPRSVGNGPIQEKPSESG